MSNKDLTVDILAAAKIDENNIRKLIDLQKLMKITKFSKQEIRMLYRTFKQERFLYSIMFFNHSRIVYDFTIKIKIYDYKVWYHHIRLDSLRSQFMITQFKITIFDYLDYYHSLRSSSLRFWFMISQCMITVYECMVNDYSLR